MILAVNLLGNPNNFDAINEIIGDKNIILMEDNCESMGAEFKGKTNRNFWFGWNVFYFLFAPHGNYGRWINCYG